jgi:hypothetical protein
MSTDPFDFNSDGHLDDFEEAGKAQWIDESIRQTDEEFKESGNTSGVTGTGTHSSSNYVYHTTNPVLAPFANVLLILLGPVQLALGILSVTPLTDGKYSAGESAYLLIVGTAITIPLAVSLYKTWCDRHTDGENGGRHA